MSDPFTELMDNLQHRVPREHDSRMTIEDFMSLHNRLTTSSVITASAMDYALVQHFLCGQVNGTPQMLGIASSIASTNMQTMMDLDSFIYVSNSDVPLLAWCNMDLYYRPNFDYSIKKDVGICYTYNNTAFGKGPISKCPNICFAKHGDIFVSDITLLF